MSQCLWGLRLSSSHVGSLVCHRTFFACRTPPKQNIENLIRIQRLMTLKVRENKDFLRIFIFFYASFGFFPEFPGLLPNNCALFKKNVKNISSSPKKCQKVAKKVPDVFPNFAKNSQRTGPESVFEFLQRKSQIGKTNRPWNPRLSSCFPRFSSLVLRFPSPKLKKIETLCDKNRFLIVLL